jgi:hypothetical protein
MAFIESIKAAATVVVALAKENPAVAVGVAVGTVVVGYGGYRGIKCFRNRGTVVAPVAAVELVAGATPIMPIEVDVVDVLLGMSRAEAEASGVLKDWNEALLAKLRAKKK